MEGSSFTSSVFMQKFFAGTAEHMGISPIFFYRCSNLFQSGESERIFPLNSNVTLIVDGVNVTSE